MTRSPRDRHAPEYEVERRLPEAPECSCADDNRRDQSGHDYDARSREIDHFCEMGARMMLTVLCSLALLAAWCTPLQASDLSASTEEALRSADEIYVATQRRSGELSARKPIWFVYEDDRLFFTTAPDSWKAKRIARGSPLYVWIGDEADLFVIGNAESVTDPVLIDRMGEAYAEKYWIAWLGFFQPRSSRVAEGKTNAYLVTLREAEPPKK